MRAELYTVPIPFHLESSIMPRPRGGEWLQDEIQALHQAGVRVLVSLLTFQEQWDSGITQEGKLCEENGIVYRAFLFPTAMCRHSLKQPLILSIN